MEMEAGKDRKADRKADRKVERQGSVSCEPFDKTGPSATWPNRLDCFATHGDAAYDNGSTLILRSSGIDGPC
jgi:hypothetical protein